MYRKGQRFRVTRERPVPILIHWGAPLTIGVTSPLPVGTVLVVTQDPPPTSRGFYSAPEEYERPERDLIPVEDYRSATRSSLATTRLANGLKHSKGRPLPSSRSAADPGERRQ